MKNSTFDYGYQTRRTHWFNPLHGTGFGRWCQILIAFIHHEGRHTIRKVEIHKETYNETQKYTMNIQAKIQKI